MRKRAETKTVLLAQPEDAYPNLLSYFQGDEWRVNSCKSWLKVALRLKEMPYSAVVVHEDILSEKQPLSDLKELAPDTVVIVALKSFADSPSGADVVCRLQWDAWQLPEMVSAAARSTIHKRLLDEVREENRRMRAKIEEQEDELRTFQDEFPKFGTLVTEPNALFKNALDAFHRKTGAERLSLMLLDEDTDDPELRIVEAMGISEDIIPLARRKLGEGVAGWVAQHGKMMFKGPSGKNMERKGSCSYEDDTFVSVPLKAEDEIFGVVNITEGLNSDDFTTQKLNTLSLLARHAAVWINYCQTLQKLKKLSLMDELTSLYNRRFFDDALEREIQRVGRSGGQMSLAILDIDHFKIYNDTYGHPAGDRVLKEFASLLHSNVRTTDFICRFGGEEFAIILTDTGKEPEREESNAHFINRLRYLIDKYKFEGEELLPGGSLTISAGVADYPSDAASAEELVAVADKRLYEAKNSGRNRICA